MPRISRELYDVLRRAGVKEDVIRGLQGEPDQLPGAAQRRGLDELARLLNRPEGEQQVVQHFSREQADYVAGKIVEELQRQPGIPTRQPPQNAPTFYAKPFSYVGVCSLANQAPFNHRRFGCRWQPFADPGTGLVGHTCMEGYPSTSAFPTAAEPWPTGFFGVLTHVEVYCGQVESYVLADPTRQVRWSLFKNGSAVPGYLNTVPTTHAASVHYVSGAAQTTAALAPRNPLVSFVPIHPQDTIELEVRNLNTQAVPRYSIVAVVAGYSVPVQGDGRTPEQFTRD